MRGRVMILALILGGGAVSAVLDTDEEGVAEMASRSGSPAPATGEALDVPLPALDVLDAPLPAEVTITDPEAALGSAPGFGEPARSENLLHTSASSLLNRIDDPTQLSLRMGALRVLADRHPSAARVALPSIALDPRAPLELRVAAVKEAAISGDLVSAAVLLEAARPGQPAALRLASLHALGRHPDADPAVLGGMLEQEPSEAVRLQIVLALRQIGDPVALTSLEASARGTHSGPLRVALYRTGREISFRSNLPLGEELRRLGPTR